MTDDSARTGFADRGVVAGVGTVHSSEPDYHQPLLEISLQVRERLLGHLRLIYGEALAEKTLPELERIMRVYHAHKPEQLIAKERRFDPRERFTEKDLVLITYGDLIRGEEKTPLASMAKLADTYLKTTNTLHILPFFPSSSDRGFSIIDFETVDPNLGSWDEIEDLKGRYKLMFDGVFNHVSSKSRWFQEFLSGNPLYQKYFIAYGSPEDLTPEQQRMIVRPRTTDVLTRFQSIHGPVYVWTTFSPDQIDLNFANPEVLLRVIETLLLYVRRGADIIRLDAVTYLWAAPGTLCANLEESHEIVKLFRTILDLVAPPVVLITETNVPHDENIAYFGNGYDEAHMVYNFALPPLVLHTFCTGDVSVLSRWAAGLEPLSDQTTFFNFLDSHDGIGLLGAQGILSSEQIDDIVERAQEHGAFISNRMDREGRESPYEINTTWYSALNREDSCEDLDLQVKRFVASRVIGLVMRGVPTIYLHGLIGTQNDVEAVLATQSKRAINRTAIDARAIHEAISDPDSKLSRIAHKLYLYTARRAKLRAFHPRGEQKILLPSADVFAVLRTSPEGDERVLVLVNVTDRKTQVTVGCADLEVDDTRWADLCTRNQWETQDQTLEVTLGPYDTVWLRPISEMPELTG